MTTTSTRHLRTILLTFVMVVSATVIGPGSITPVVEAAVETGSYFDGQVAYSQVINCWSSAQGNPYPERGAAAWTGQYADPTNLVPFVGQTFMIHVVVYGLGNACAGMKFVPGLTLPAGLSFDTTLPIVCLSPYGTSVSPSSDCPGWSNVRSGAAYGGGSMYLSSDDGSANTWPLPAGNWWEFRFPVYASAPVTNGTLSAFVKMLDGNSSPILRMTAPLYVYSEQTPPSVRYDTPSTVASPTMPTGGDPISTRYGIYSVAEVFTNGSAGTAHLDLGTSPGDYTTTVSVDIPRGDRNWSVLTDWSEPEVPTLRPGTTYYWRARFVRQNTTYRGEAQSFTVPSSCDGRQVTVSLALGQQPTDGDDVILGTAASESISGGGGNDVICAGGGKDALIGGPGSDRLFGGGGIDRLDGGANADRCDGGPGRDSRVRCETVVNIP